jgi:hypothetical protein
LRARCSGQNSNQQSGQDETANHWPTPGSNPGPPDTERTWSGGLTGFVEV